MTVKAWICGIARKERRVSDYDCVEYQFAAADHAFGFAYPIGRFGGAAQILSLDCIAPMKTTTAVLVIIASLMVASHFGWSQGVVIWNGPIITFTQPAGMGTRVQDHLTPDVWLTRDTSQGLFNAVTEVAYTKDFSPQDTAWAYGSLAAYATLSYTDWEDWNGHNPPSMVNQAAVVHLISENIYLSLTFTSWAQGGGGGFSYVRSTPDASAPQLTLTTSGTNVVLTWPTNVSGYTLQSSTNLISTAVWSNQSGHYVVTNPITGSQMFYRLSQSPP